MPVPVTLVDAGGFPITDTPGGIPMTPTDGATDDQPFAFAVTLVEAGGFPAALVNDDLSDWEPPEE